MIYVVAKKTLKPFMSKRCNHNLKVTPMVTPVKFYWDHSPTVRNKYLLLILEKNISEKRVGYVIAPVRLPKVGDVFRMFDRW